MRPISPTFGGFIQTNLIFLGRRGRRAPPTFFFGFINDSRSDEQAEALRPRRRGRDPGIRGRAEAARNGRPMAEATPSDVVVSHLRPRHRHSHDQNNRRRRRGCGSEGAAGAGGCEPVGRDIGRRAGGQLESSGEVRQPRVESERVAQLLYRGKSIEPMLHRVQPRVIDIGRAPHTPCHKAAVRRDARLDPAAANAGSSARARVRWPPRVPPRFLQQVQRIDCACEGLSRLQRHVQADESDASSDAAGSATQTAR